MANIIKLKRGLSSDISTLTLQPGEVAVVLDLGTLKIGDQNGNVTDLLATSALRSNFAGALENTIAINGIDFNGTQDVEIPALIEAGDHIDILSDKVISVVDIGNLEELTTTAKDTLVQAINETVDTNENLSDTILIIKTNLENRLSSAENKISQLESQIGNISVKELFNNLLSITEADGIQIGNSSSLIQTSINDTSVKFYKGERDFLSIKENSSTNEIQTFCESLNSESVVCGVHERKEFSVDGVRRTGFFYFDGGEN